MTIGVKLRAVFLTRPDEVVGFHRVEVENFESDTVRRKRTLLFVPGMTGIGRIPELFGGGDKIGSVVAE